MPVIFMERSLLDSLTEADIKEIIDENEGHTKYARLEGYYEGDHDILRHTKKDSTAPNNRLVNNMAKYITDTATGYFIGKPVVYSSQNDAYLEALQDIFDYNDEQDENMELAKGASINGDCFEMLYMDEDAQIRFTKVPPDGCIYICETGYNTPMAAIRIVYSKDKDKNIIKKVEFWTAQDCWYFRSINGGALELLDIREHYNAERLVRTECKYFANQGEVMGYKETGIEEYQFLGGTEHSGSCTCSELNGRVFRVDEAEPGVNLPPIHPNCLCIIRAYFKKSVFAKREGNPLDGNIKFEEWKKKYAS